MRSFQKKMRREEEKEDEMRQDETEWNENRNEMIYNSNSLGGKLTIRQKRKVEDR